MASQVHVGTQQYPLLRKLQHYRGSDSVIAATTLRAVEVATMLGNELNLPHYTHYCKAITHPGSGNRTIGSITSREVILNDEHATLPQGYIEHQIALMKHLLRREDQERRPETKDKLVIIVRESIEGGDQVSAVVEELRKAGARGVVLATPLVLRKAMTSLETLVDELVYGSIHPRSTPLHGHVRERSTNLPGDIRLPMQRPEYV